MKRYLIATGLPFFLATTIFAQEKGIHFEHGISWKQVVAKAKAEHKLIMVDCYTTWCGPCKMMDKGTFTDQKVGAFFNEHFINAKMQMDTSKGDSKEVKDRYSDARFFESNYKIEAYPTILFFDADGKLADKSLGYREGGDFLKVGENVLDPNKRLYPLIEKFKKNPDDTANLTKLAARINDLDENTRKQIYNKYLATGYNQLTPEKINFLFYYTTSVKNKGFELLKQRAKEIDAQMGKGSSKSKISEIILEEEVVPILNKHRGDIEKVDWTGIKKQMDAKYPAYADEVVMNGKLSVLFMTRQTEKRLNKMEQFIRDYESKQEALRFADILNVFASDMAHSSDDVKLLDKALGWSKKTLSTPGLPDRERGMYTDTYASLLYKTGKKAEAIKAEKEAIDLGNKTGDNLSVDVEKQMLKRMENGEKDPFTE